MNEESLFVAALGKASAAERRAFLDAACGGDQRLRDRVELLLAADGQTCDILDQGPDAAALLGEGRPAPPLAADQPFAGRFHLRRKLGEGGMGEVWVADQADPVRRTVALKVIRPGLVSDRLLARFEAERQALALMDHPNIARVYDAGTVEPPGRSPAGAGQPYFVMELVEGVPITQFCDDHRLTPRQRLELFVPVCRAVQHAHQKGVIHRDLKPSNILVATYDGRPVPKVIDFGVAKATGPRLADCAVSTEVGALVGTPEYMSPEQAEPNSRDVDTRTDVYALGVVLYELLTGGVPFPRRQLQATPFAEMLRIIKEVEPPRPSARLAETRTAEHGRAGPRPAARVPRLYELDWIVMKCLEKDRARRYDTADALARDVERYLNEEPVEAGPPGAGYRLGKFARRHRRALAAASAFVLLLVAAVVALTVALVAVDRERQDKQAALEAEGKRRKQARAALDAMSSQVIEEWLARQPELLPEHEQFLGQALRSYEEFAADTGQEEESRAGVAQAYRRAGVIRHRLGRRPEAEAAWDRSRELYAGLAADFPRVPAYREELARTHHHLGTHYSDTGRLREAEAALRQGLTIRRGLVGEFPDVPAYGHGLAGNLTTLGILLQRVGRPQEAEDVYRQALAVLKQLAFEFPDELSYAADQADVYLSLSELFVVNTGRSHEAVRNDPGRFREAAEAAAQAVAIYERLAARYRKERRYRAELAGSLNNQGNLLRDAARYPEAEEAFRRAVTTRQQLVDEFPGVPHYKRGLAITLNNLGILLKNTDRAEQAEKVYGQALAIHKQLAAEYPDRPVHQNEAAGAMVNLARLLLARKDFGGARRLLEEAVPHHQAALTANPRDPGYRFFYRLNRLRMAETLLELKDHAVAAAAAGQFLQMGVEPARDAYTAAGLLAGCVRLADQDERLPEGERRELASAYGDRALAALRQAVEKGAKEVAEMGTDPSLDPLRSREDFRKLLAESEAERKP
jgi:tetratricopeptide (TPR) repeat protein